MHFWAKYIQGANGKCVQFVQLVNYRFGDRWCLVIDWMHNYRALYFVRWIQLFLYLLYNWIRFRIVVFNCVCVVIKNDSEHRNRNNSTQMTQLFAHIRTTTMTMTTTENIRPKILKSIILAVKDTAIVCHYDNTYASEVNALNATLDLSLTSVLKH